MASLIDELIDVLTVENEEYRILMDIAKKKTPVIVAGDVDGLKNITLEEQTHLDRIIKSEKKRKEVVSDMALVMNIKEKEITIKSLVGVLGGQPEAKKRLSLIHDELLGTLKDFDKINELNKQLLKDSLEMNEFNLNLMRNKAQAPETANYDSRSKYTDDTIDYGQGIFDAQQ